jgi:RimJ/RimL family protein N-acetyltransferase
MSDYPEYLQTERLKLRRWRAADVEPMIAINSDPKVFEFYPHVPKREESVRMMEKIPLHFERHNLGLWCAENLSGEVMGFIGLNVPDYEAPFTPCVEIGWRLGSQFWGKGYATEGAKECLRDGFERVGLKEIVAMTTPRNIRSQRVMIKLGMTRDFDSDFEHPKVQVGNPHRPHILFRISRNAWEKSR